MAMDYAKTAAQVLEAIGGKSNVVSATHCITRLRFVLKDESGIDDEKVKGIKGVMGVMRKGGQYQVIIGNDVAVCYTELAKLGDFDDGKSKVEEVKVKQKFTFKGWVNSVLDTIAGSMTPILPAIIGCGMVKLVIVLLDLFHVSSELPTYQILTVVGDTGFYFLPLLLAYSASKKMKCSPILALVIVGVLIHPSMISMLDAGGVTFLKLPVTSATYTSSVIPALLSVWLLSKLEPIAERVFKGWMHIVLKPLVLFLVCAPITLLILAPMGMWIGTGMALVLNWAQDKAGWLTLGVYSALMPLVVMSGMHYAVVPYVLSNLATLGFDTLQLPAMLASNLGQAAASAAVAIRSKNKDLKAIASASAVSAATSGVTEPALYGVTLKLKRPLIASMIGSGMAGVVGGFFGLKGYAFVTPSLIAMPMFISSEYAMNIVYACVVAVISVIITFVMTLILGWEDPVDEDEETTVSTEDDIEKTVVEQVNENGVQIISSPVKGKIIPLEQVNDETFSSGMMGHGIAVEPTEGKVYAPFDGECEMMFETLHAMGLTSNSGVSILIHVGLETVGLNGKPFTAHVNSGDKINKGQLLLEFDMEAIKAAGCETVTPILVTNEDEVGEVTIENGSIIIGGNL
ncbi:MAG: beta-glucoside-specific PTS transporter subunit IIABC [Lachnospiraceae bacterium]|nr:beta-glucoside-specific PTS transporter subunit IIABC [Lachnospiraceae bacterium]MDD3617328.1 beta-glucoside-specific PTS transporter subunit IIABC [Lachnospiraceae bacterium]